MLQNNDDQCENYCLHVNDQVPEADSVACPDLQRCRGHSLAETKYLRQWQCNRLKIGRPSLDFSVLSRKKKTGELHI